MSPQDEALVQELRKQEFQELAQDLSWGQLVPWEENLDTREQEREQQERIQELWLLERNG